MSNIINAEGLFEIRREAAELQVGTNEVQLMKDAICWQVPYFFGYLEQLSAEAAERLLPMFEDGLKAKIASSTDLTDGSKPCLDDEGIVSYRHNKGKLVSVLQLGVPLISYFNSKLVPVCDVSDQDITPEHSDPEHMSQRRLSAATAMATWMALGKWTFDLLDPRQSDEWKDSISTQKSLARTVDLQVSGIDLPDEALATEIDRKLLMARYRWMGRAIYKGALNAFDQPNDSILRSNIHLMERLSTSNFLEQFGADRPNKPNAVQYAMAMPLTSVASAELLRRFMSYNEVC